MKKIPLSQNKFALVDDEDFDFLNQWKWHLSNTGYAMCSIHLGKGSDGKYKHKNISMHRLINKTPKGKDTDHINHHTLDNRKANLRTVSRKQNHWNMKTRNTSKSGISGVNWSNSKKRWRVRIMVDYKDIYIGVFKYLEDAINARKKAEKRYYEI